MKIVQVDNFNRENISEVLIASNIKDQGYAECMCRALNASYSGESSSAYFKVFTDDYTLYRFEP